MTYDVVDLYAGPGGWDEGMKMLGLTSVVGLEWDHAACLTAVAAGHNRIRADVSKYCIEVFADVKGLIASPPCQAWSMAGKRQGEVDRAKVHELVDAYANGSDDPGTEWADERSHHAAQPVRWVRKLRPQWVALEQVPPVLGLWQHVAERMRRWGYSTWTGVLNSADYGVPQTRERAVLIARLDGPALPPEQTHAREPGDVDLFGGQLLPWVSMADALGWSDDVEVISNYGTGGDPRRKGRRSSGQPSATLTSKTDRMKVTGGTLDRRTNSKGPRGTVYPSPTVGLDRPAPTLTGQVGTQWVLRNGSQSNSTERPLTEPAPTVAFGHAVARCEWIHTRPATTVQGDPRIGRPGHKDRDKGEAQFEQDSVKISQAEAAVLQSFRPDYPWQGTKTKQFEQIGNAVPPLLAARIVGALVGAEVPA